MDKASDYESGDSRFESWQGRFFTNFFFFFPSLFFALQLLLLHTYQDTCPSLFKIRKKLKWIKITYRGSFQFKPHPSENFAEKRVTSRAVFESFLGYKELKLTTKLLAGRTFRSLLIYWSVRMGPRAKYTYFPMYSACEVRACAESKMDTTVLTSFLPSFSFSCLIIFPLLGI